MFLARSFLKSFLFVLFAWGLSFADTQAKLVGSFSSWSVYTQIEDGQKVCFLSSNPKESYGNYKKRSKPYIWVRKISNEVDEVSITPGYKYKTSIYPRLAYYKSAPEFAKVKEVIKKNALEGKCEFKSEDAQYAFEVTDLEEAWVKDVEDDESMIKGMISGNYAVVIARSIKDTCSADIYSLVGFAKAYQKMQEVCRE